MSNMKLDAKQDIPEAAELHRVTSEMACVILRALMAHGKCAMFSIDLLNTSCPVYSTRS